MMNAPMIRAMANIICDHDIDVLRDLNTSKIVRIMLRAGFTSQELLPNLEKAVEMAAIRQRNEEKKHENLHPRR